MPVRIRITLLFALVVFVILGIVCGSIYYFSYTSRIDTIKNRLLNRAMTTARLLSQSEIFTQQLIQRIDSSTTLTIKNKIVHAYDYQNQKIYDYSDNNDDTIHIEEEVLDDARVKESFFIRFTMVFGSILNAGRPKVLLFIAMTFLILIAFLS